MSPVQGESDRYYETPRTARLAAVMALLYPGIDEWELILIKRPSHPKDLHAGQISFPGGGLEEQDHSFEDCALRETREEIGIPASNIEVIGNLTKLYVYASNNLVYPYVGYMRERLEFYPDTKEVERIIKVPMSYFSKPSIVKTKELRVRGYRLPKVPYYDIDGEILWGATAMMIAEFVHLWEKVN